MDEIRVQLRKYLARPLENFYESCVFINDEPVFITFYRDDRSEDWTLEIYYKNIRRKKIYCLSGESYNDVEDFFRIAVNFIEG